MTPFLDRLEPATRDGMVSAGRVRRFPAKAVLFLEEDDASSVHVLRSGLVKIVVVAADREVMLDVLGAGDLLGEVSAIARTGRTGTATTLTAVEALAIRADTFVDLARAHADLSWALLESMTDRLRSATRRQLEYGALDAVGRVCGRLAELIERFGTERDGGVSVDIPLSQSDIAAWAGLSREAVVKALQSLRTLGWVDTSGRSITVLRPAEVRARAGL